MAAHIRASDGDTYCGNCVLDEQFWAKVPNCPAIEDETLTGSDLKCPKCGAGVVKAAVSVFIEHGAYDGKHCEEEGDCDVLKCTVCSFKFVDVSGFDLKEVTSESTSE